MNVYLYKYSCPRWYGTHTGIKNIASTHTNIDDIVAETTQLENDKSGSVACKIDLLQKYELSIVNITNFAALTSIPMNVVDNTSLDRDTRQ